MEVLDLAPQNLDKPPPLQMGAFGLMMVLKTKRNILQICTELISKCDKIQESREYARIVIGG